MALPTPHTQRAHAQLAPSAAHRWMMCPGSVKASEGIPERASVYAAEGTAAHTLANLVLAEDIDPAAHLGDVIDINDAKKPLHHDLEADGITRFEITEEMVDAVNTYADFVRSVSTSSPGVTVLEVEQRLDMRHIHPAIFGTGDAVVYDPLAEHLHVCDFKYGKGVIVEPENNPQLFLYGAGAARRYHNQRLARITLHVIQPRAPGDPVKSWETDVLELFDFEGDVAKAAARCFEPEPPLFAGEWCDSGFCPIRATCAVRRQQAMNDALAEFDDAGEMTLPAIADLSPDERGRVLRQADQIFSFVKAVQEAEHANALAGNPPTGFKLVAKRAVRKWADDKEAMLRLRGHGVTADQMLTDPKLKSPAQVESAIGKKAFAEILAAVEDTHDEKLVIQKSSGVNLVPNEDPRPAVATDASAEFSAVE